MKKMPLILASILVLSAISCGDSASSGVPETTASANAEKETSAAETEPERAPCGVTKDLDFGGKAFRTSAFDWQGYRYYFFAEEENGDVMNDAIYHRMRKVEETVNVKVQSEVRLENCNEFANSMKKVLMSGEDVYDQLFMHCIDGISTFAASGFLYNLDDLPHIDIKADWWNQEQMDVLRLGKNTYYGVNDFMIPSPYVVFFNKDLTKNLKFEDPYQLVYDGKWTLDRFEEMARAATQDIDGNGKWDEKDSYGVTASEVSKYVSFMTSSEQFMTRRDADGRVQLDMNTEKMVSLVERFDRMAEENMFFRPKSEAITDQLTIDTGRIMFTLADTAHAETMRGFTVEFGFLPFPKYDEAQESYRSLDWGGLMAVPTTITDPDCVGAVIELMAYESAEEVIPTYYNTILTGKLARDDDAVKMLDILFDTVCYEVGGNYFGFGAGIGDLFFSLPRLTVEGQKGEFASWYAKKEKQALKVIEKFYEDLETVEGNS